MQITDEIRDYWDSRSNGFSESVKFEIAQGSDGFSSRLLDSMDMSPGDRVLDVGCGPGYFALAVRGTGVKVTGIDISEEMVGKARENSAGDPNSSFMVMDVHHLGFPDGSFDQVFCRNVLWNLLDPQAAYSEMFRVLRPGGKVGIIDGNYYLGRSEDGDFGDGGCHGRFNTDGVDFSVMTRIARDLPLSSCERPAWDVSVLGSMEQCRDVHIVFGGASRHADGVPGSFMLLARKVDG